MPYHLLVTIYNSAGEEVRHLYSGKSQDSPDGFSMDATAFMPGGAGVTLGFEGILDSGGKTLNWQGDNDNGQWVSGGTYYMKAEISDSFGAVQSWIHPLSVLPRAAAQSLNIYNAAGELVIRIDTASFSSSPISRLGLKDAGKESYVLGSGGGVDFMLENTGGQQMSQHWDGKSGNGTTVSSGTYTVQLVDDSSGHQVLVSKSFVVMADPVEGHFGVIAGPNPLGRDSQALVFQLSGLSPSEASHVGLYNLAGELIAQGLASAGSSRITLTVGNWSSGIYVAVAESYDGRSLKARKLLRIAVQR